MRRVALICILLAATLPALAEDWTTNDGRVYKNVIVTGTEEDGVRVSYDGGVGKVFYSDMPLDLQKRFGQDPATLAAKKKAAEQTLTAQQQAAAALAARLKAEQAAAAANMPPAAPGATGGPRNVSGAATPGVPGTPAAPGVPGMPKPQAPGAKPATHYNASGQALPGTPGYRPPGTAGAYPGAKYSYDTVLDKSYLDSPPIELEATGGTGGDIGSAVLRSSTDGRDPQMPEQVEVIFLSSGSPTRVADAANMSLVVDGKTIPVAATPKKDTSVIPFTPPGYSSFNVTTDQARSFRNPATMEINVGGTVYKVTADGGNAAEGYFITLSHLPPASPSIVKMFHKFIAGIPSFATMISALCGWVFLGAFGIFVTGFVVIMIIGIVRFINVG